MEESVGNLFFLLHLDAMEVGHSTCVAVFDDDPEVVAGGDGFFGCQKREGNNYFR